MAGRDTNHSTYSGTVMKLLFPHCRVHLTLFLALENGKSFQEIFFFYINAMAVEYTEVY